jgi:hypothetical protein
MSLEALTDKVLLSKGHRKYSKEYKVTGNISNRSKFDYTSCPKKKHSENSLRAEIQTSLDPGLDPVFLNGGKVC